MMAVTLTNTIDPPPRLTGDSGRDTVSVIQWLSSFYTKGILSGALLQTENLGSNFASQYPGLASLAALVAAADQMAYFTGPDQLALTNLTAFARSFLDDADAAAVRLTIGAGTVTGVTGTAPIVSSGGDAPDISIDDFVGSGITHARGAVPDPGAVAGAVKFLREDAAWATPPGAGDVVGPAGATGGNVVVFNGATGKAIKDGGTLGTAAFNATGDFDAAGAAAAAQAASQPVDADLTTWAGVTPGANVATALAVAVGTDGAFVVKGGALGSPSSAGTIPAHTLGGTVSGGGNQINNVIIGASTPLAGSFTTISATGLVDISGAAAGQVKFPAVQNASADANTLDDYEEQVWTPAQGAGLTVVGAFSSAGTYTKIGNVVVATFKVVGATSVAVTAAGVITNNLPFTVGGRDHLGAATNNSANVSVVIDAAAASTTVYACSAIAATAAIHCTVTYTV